MKQKIKSIPGLSYLAKLFYFNFYTPLFLPFKSSASYWEKRYRNGGNSGSGSYNKLSLFKAEVLNDFVKQNEIQTIIEYGCGDGSQLSLFEFPFYTGFDVSNSALLLCKNLFSNDATKIFKNMTDYRNETAQLTLSLDVIYHLVENSVFNNYMDILFDSSEKYVIIYSSNTDQQEKIQAPHVKHRKFTEWVKKHKNNWQLIQTTPNKYPYKGNDLTGSFSDFYIFQKT